MERSAAIHQWVARCYCYGRATSAVRLPASCAYHCRSACVRTGLSHSGTGLEGGGSSGNLAQVRECTAWRCTALARPPAAAAHAAPAPPARPCAHPPRPSSLHSHATCDDAAPGDATEGNYVPLLYLVTSNDATPNDACSTQRCNTQQLNTERCDWPPLPERRPRAASSSHLSVAAHCGKRRLQGAPLCVQAEAQGRLLIAN